MGRWCGSQPHNPPSPLLLLKTQTQTRRQAATQARTHAPPAPATAAAATAALIPPADLRGDEAHVGDGGAHQVQDVLGLLFLWGEAQVGVEAPAEVHDAVLPEELGALVGGWEGWDRSAALGCGGRPAGPFCSVGGGVDTHTHIHRPTYIPPGRCSRGGPAAPCPAPGPCAPAPPAKSPAAPPALFVVVVVVVGGGNVGRFRFDGASIDWGERR